ncbi:DDE-type integrase/transposase/recombinase [Deinococcus oregonensis]|uniref:DDE-type integrase/transposase/recombinase n=1 Tax=Deinococcus oregonensis TaxID=1805970 RepID=A0ABV6B271_9DEIO
MWRVDEHGFVLDIFVQRQRNRGAARTFLTKLLGEYDVPEVIHPDRLQSFGAAVRQLPSLADVDSQAASSTARRNTITLPEYRAKLRPERSQQGFRRRTRVQEFLSLHARVTHLHLHTRTSVPAPTRGQCQKGVLPTWSATAVGVG